MRYLWSVGGNPLLLMRGSVAADTGHVFRWFRIQPLSKPLWFAGAAILALILALSAYAAIWTTDGGGDSVRCVSDCPLSLDDWDLEPANPEEARYGEMARKYLRVQHGWTGPFATHCANPNSPAVIVWV